MTSFVVTDATTTAQTLTSNETGFVGSLGGIYDIVGTAAVTMSGVGATLTAAGDIFGNTYGVEVTNGLGHNLTFLQSANIYGQSAGISMSLDTSSTTSSLTNHGSIAGTFGADIDGDNTGVLSMINTGDFTGTGNGLNVEDMFSFQLVNSGVITGAGFAGITLSDTSMSGGDAVIVNTGEISGTVFGVTSTNVSLTLKNTGTINGIISLGDLEDYFDGRDGVQLDFILMGGGQDRFLGGAGVDQVDGGQGNDFLRSFGGDDELTGGSGDDIMRGGSGDDRLFGQDGKDTIMGGLDDDIVSGGSGSDLLSGGRGDDQMDGGSGNDLLIGGTGGDVLFGGSKNDTLYGGSGEDFLTGDSGNDTFLFSAMDGLNLITDFGDGADVIDLSSLFLTDFAQLTTAGAFDDYDGGVLIDLTVFGYDTRIMVQGKQEADLSASDFLI